MWYKKRY